MFHRCFSLYSEVYRPTGEWRRRRRMWQSGKEGSEMKLTWLQAARLHYFLLTQTSRKLDSKEETKDARVTIKAKHQAEKGRRKQQTVVLLSVEPNPNSPLKVGFYAGEFKHFFLIAIFKKIKPYLFLKNLILHILWCFTLQSITVSEKSRSKYNILIQGGEITCTHSSWHYWHLSWFCAGLRSARGAGREISSIQLRRADTNLGLKGKDSSPLMLNSGLCI